MPSSHEALSTISSTLLVITTLLIGTLFPVLFRQPKPEQQSADNIINWAIVKWAYYSVVCFITTMLLTLGSVICSFYSPAQDLNVLASSSIMIHVKTDLSYITYILQPAHWLIIASIWFSMGVIFSMQCLENQLIGIVDINLLSISKYFIFILLLLIYVVVIIGYIRYESLLTDSAIVNKAWETRKNSIWNIGDNSVTNNTNDNDSYQSIDITEERKINIERNDDEK